MTRKIKIFFSPVPSKHYKPMKSNEICYSGVVEKHDKLSWGQWCKSRLVHLGMSQRELSRRLNKTPDTVNRWLAEKYMPIKEKDVPPLAEQMDISSEDLPYAHLLYRPDDDHIDPERPRLPDMVGALNGESPSKLKASVGAQLRLVDDDTLMQTLGERYCQRATRLYRILERLDFDDDSAPWPSISLELLKVPLGEPIPEELQGVVSLIAELRDAYRDATRLLADHYVQQYPERFPGLELSRFAVMMDDLEATYRRVEADSPISLKLIRDYLWLQRSAQDRPERMFEYEYYRSHMADLCERGVTDFEMLDLTMLWQADHAGDRPTLKLADEAGDRPLRDLAGAENPQLRAAKLFDGRRHPDQAKKPDGR